MNKAIKIISLLIGLSILFALIQRVGVSEIMNAISRADYRLILCGIIFYITLIFIRAFKWHLLIDMTGNKVKYSQLLPVCLTNSLLRNLTPFRSGEMAIPLLLKKYLKIPVGQGLSIFILDRFFELLIFSLLLFLAILYTINTGIQDGPAIIILKQIFIIVVAFVAVFIIVLISKKTTFKILSIFNFLKRFSLIKRVLEFIEKELRVFYDTLPLFKAKGLFRSIIPLTFLCWFFEIIAFYLIFSSVIFIPIINVSVAQIISAAATFVTFLPGGIGIAEGGFVYVLKLFGYSSVLTLGGALLARIFLTGTLLITGFLGLLLLKEKDTN